MIAFNNPVCTAPVEDTESRCQISGRMSVFSHLLYEYKKGLRDLVLHTCDYDSAYGVIRKLEQNRMDYLIYPLGTKRINVFFGKADCLEIIRRIGKINLSRYTAEEDFILGIMLGYDRYRQCERYLTMRYENAFELQNVSTVKELM